MCAHAIDDVIRKAATCRGAGLRIGGAGAVIVLVGGLWSPPLLYLGMLLSLIALALVPATANHLAREPLTWGFAALVIWVGIRGWIDLKNADPQVVAQYAEQIWGHIRYTGVVPLIVGGWLAVWWHRRTTVMAVVCLGVLAYYAYEWHAIAIRLPIGNYHHGSDPKMGLIAVTYTVLCAGMALRLWQTHPEARTSAIATLRALASTAAVASLLALLFSWSRSGWLSFAVLLVLVGAAASYYAIVIANSRQRRWVMGTIGGIGIALLALFWAFSGAIWERIGHGEDLQTVAAILTGDFGPANSGSFAKRWRLLVQGLHDIARFPLWGIGPISVRDMLDSVLGRIIHGQGDYNNTYINLAVAMGLPWTIFWVGFHASAIARAGYILWEQERERVLAGALVGACFVHFADLMFQTQIWNVEAAAMYIILMSLVFAVILHPRKAHDIRSSDTSIDGSSAGISRAQ